MWPAGSRSSLRVTSPRSGGCSLSLSLNRVQAESAHLSAPTLIASSPRTAAAVTGAAPILRWPRSSSHGDGSRATRRRDRPGHHGADDESSTSHGLRSRCEAAAEGLRGPNRLSTCTRASPCPTLDFAFSRRTAVHLARAWANPRPHDVQTGPAPDRDMRRWIPADRRAARSGRGSRGRCLSASAGPSLVRAVFEGDAEPTRSGRRSSPLVPGLTVPWSRGAAEHRGRVVLILEYSGVGRPTPFCHHSDPPSPRRDCCRARRGLASARAIAAGSRRRHHAATP